MYTPVPYHRFLGLNLLGNGEDGRGGKITGASRAAEDAAPLPQRSVPVGTGHASVQRKPVDLFAVTAAHFIIQ